MYRSYKLISEVRGITGNIKLYIQKIWVLRLSIP